MHQPSLLSASLALALLLPPGVEAANPDELARIRKEIAELKATYENHIQALEQRLQKAESEAQSAHEAVRRSEAVVQQASPAVAAPASRDNAFNPAISLILSGLYAQTSRDPSGYAISGFGTPAGAEIGPGSRGLSLAESELGISANIDPNFRGSVAISFSPENEVSVEEAFVETTGLSHGLTVKGGRFFSGIGYLNAQHAHVWDFVDSPLAYQAFLGGQYSDDGLQLRWLAPTDTYLELGAELMRGRNFPGTDNGGNGAASRAAHAHVGGDIGESHSWRAGLSWLDTSQHDLQTAASDRFGNPVTNGFSGSNRIWLADFVWKWAPEGNALDRSFKLQGEFLHRTQHGELVYDRESSAQRGAYDSTQYGGYLQAIYQFMPHWRFGLRSERLEPGHLHYGANAAVLAAPDYVPTRSSLMVDFSPSEFSRMRMQFSRDRSRQNLPDNQFFLQYQMSLGAHGAHLF